MDASLFKHLMLVLLFCMRSSTVSVCFSVGLLGGRSFYWSDNPLLSALPVRILGFDLTSRELLAEWSSDGQASMVLRAVYNVTRGKNLGKKEPKNFSKANTRLPPVQIPPSGI